MMEHDEGHGKLPSETVELFGNNEIEILKQELPALQDVIGAIRAYDRSCASIQNAFKRKTIIIEKLQKENRRVLECSAKLEELRHWRELRARSKSERQVRQLESVT